MSLYEYPLFCRRYISFRSLSENCTKFLFFHNHRIQGIHSNSKENPGLQFQIEGKEKQVEIKIATVANLKDIQELNHQLCIKEAKEFDSTINEDYPIQKDGEEYFKERIENGCAFVADVDNKIVGYLIGGISEASDYRNISKIAEAENMYVLEEYRSLGIGGKLFQEFTDWCKARGIEKMKVVVSSKNTKAIEFYKKEGFEDYDVTLEKTL